MAAKLSDELGIAPELIQGDKGVFDVRVDGELIYSKHASGSFPGEREIVELLRKRLGTGS